MVNHCSHRFANIPNSLQPLLLHHSFGKLQSRQNPTLAVLCICTCVDEWDQRKHKMKQKKHNSAALLNDHKPQMLIPGSSTFPTVLHCFTPSPLSSNLQMLLPSQMLSMFPIFLRKWKWSEEISYSLPAPCAAFSLFIKWTIWVAL